MSSRNGLPPGGFEIKLMVKNFLDTKGEVSSVFPNNLLGDRWLKGFAKRCQMSACGMDHQAGESIHVARSSMSS